jgi:hypothetical protein
VILSRLADQRRTPWKNGGGETTELFVHPKGADLDHFAIRLSRASVGRAGPFSAFPGIDRSLAIVRGAGVALRVSRRAGEGAHEELVRLERASAPYAFAGELPIEAALIDGPVEDFNVMTRRSAYAHTLAWATIDGATRIARPRGIALLALVVVEGALVVAGTRLVAGEALLIDDDASVDVIGEGARVLRGEIAARGSDHA